jgi:hypothetical protein
LAASSYVTSGLFSLFTTGDIANLRQMSRDQHSCHAWKASGLAA